MIATETAIETKVAREKFKEVPMQIAVLIPKDKQEAVKGLIKKVDYNF